VALRTVFAKADGLLEDMTAGEVLRLVLESRRIAVRARTSHSEQKWVRHKLSWTQGAA
jgi:hypothetical protein